MPLSPDKREARQIARRTIDPRLWRQLEPKDRGRFLWLEAGTLMAVVFVGILPFLLRPASVRLDDALHALPGRIGDWTMDAFPQPAAVRFPALENELLRAYPTASGDHRFTAVDDNLVRVYRSASGERVRLYIGYYREQQQGKELSGDASHALRAAASPLEVTLDSGTIAINQVVPEARIQRGLIFWYDLNGRIVADMYLAKAYTVWDALTRRRTNGAVIMVAWEYPAGVEFDASRLKASGSCGNSFRFCDAACPRSAPRLRAGNPSVDGTRVSVQAFHRGERWTRASSCLAPRSACAGAASERAEILLNLGAETRRHFFRARERERLVVALRLLPQVELEILQFLQRVRLKRREVPWIGEHLIVVELPKLTHDRVELARIHAGLRSRWRSACVALPLAELATVLADVVRDQLP